MAEVPSNDGRSKIVIDVDPELTSRQAKETIEEYYQDKYDNSRQP